MEIEVRCYGRVKQALGTGRLSIAVDDDHTVGGLLDELEGTFEAFDRDKLSGPGGLLIMRSRTHIGEDTSLSDGDVVAISDSPMVEG